MSPTLSRQGFGRYTLLRLGTETNYVSFLPEYGAYVHQICLNGHKLLWNYDTPEALAELKGYKNIALLPFPNRLLEGKYEWNDRSLSFPINDPETRSALHGFGARSGFALRGVEATGRFFEATMVYEHVAERHAASYPFAAHFTCKLSVDPAAGRASWKLTGKNAQSAGAVPIGLGWHPYYTLPGGPAVWSVRMPPTERVLTQRAIPTGQTAPGPPSVASGVDIDTHWDDCFAIADPSDNRLELHGPSYGVCLQPTGSVGFLQLFVPPTQTALAVEPMSCAVDAFRQNRGAVAVESGDEIEIGMEISLLSARAVEGEI